MKYTVKRTTPNHIVTHSTGFKTYPRAFAHAANLQNLTSSQDLISIYEDGRLMDSFRGMREPVKGKEIVYAGGDYAMKYDGDLIGYKSTYGQAEEALNAYVYEFLMHQQN